MMKKFTAIFMAGLLLFIFGACQGKDSASGSEVTSTNEELTSAAEPDAGDSQELAPMEKLSAFIIENGVQKDEEYILDCPDVIEKIKASEFTIAHMVNHKAASTIEFQLIQTADGIALRLLDSSITDNGMKMERSVNLNPDGTFEYYNGLIMNGTDLGLTYKGEISASTYIKEHIPVITDSQLAPGAKMTDDSKEAMKDYIDLTLDCYAAVLSQEGIGITMADAGYLAYIAD